MLFLSKIGVDRCIYGFCGLVVLILLYQSFFWEPRVPSFSLEPSVECVGDPIFVSYPYDGRVLDPHACAPQCTDKHQRYVMYTNGRSTQCEVVPGCSDWGEDHGETCRQVAV